MWIRFIDEGWIRWPDVIILIKYSYINSKTAAIFENKNSIHQIIFTFEADIMNMSMCTGSCKVGRTYGHCKGACIQSYTCNLQAHVSSRTELELLWIRETEMRLVILVTIPNLWLTHVLQLYLACFLTHYHSGKLLWDDVDAKHHY